MKNVRLAVLIIFMAMLVSPAFSQSKGDVKKIKSLIDKYDLQFFEKGKFTSGICSVPDRPQFNGKDNTYIQVIPSRESCDAFFISDHEVTVSEYKQFILSVSGKTNFREVPKTVNYSFKVDGEMKTINIFPNIKFHHVYRKDYLVYPKSYNYPIVGISWLQANAYIHWLNSNLQDVLSSDISKGDVRFVLPSKIQWEYATSLNTATKISAKNHITNYYFPWPGETMQDNKGKYLANSGVVVTKFGVLLKHLTDDEYQYQAPVKSFPSQMNGLYDMAGNVAEWTSDSYQSSIDAINRPNLYGELEIDEKTKNQKVVKGGSFISDPIHLQIGVFQLYDENHQSSDIGFRIGMVASDTILEKLN